MVRTCRVRNEFDVLAYEDLATLLPKTFQGRTLVRAPFWRLHTTLSAETLLQVKQSDYGSLRGEYRLSRFFDPDLQNGTSEEEQGLLNHCFDRPSVSLPLILLHHLQLYLCSCKARGFFDVPSHAGYNTVQG